jgi:hypothetical protein
MVKIKEIIAPTFFVDTEIVKFIYNNYIDGLCVNSISLRLHLIMGVLLSDEQINSIIDEINEI